MPIVHEYRVPATQRAEALAAGAGAMAGEDQRRYQDQQAHRDRLFEYQLDQAAIDNQLRADSLGQQRYMFNAGQAQQAVEFGGALGGILIIAFLFIAIAAPLLAPYQPNVFSGPTLHEPSPKHPFGTDNLGRDTMSRVIYGAQISLAAGLAASIVATRTIPRRRRRRPSRCARRSSSRSPSSRT